MSSKSEVKASQGGEVEDEGGSGVNSGDVELRVVLDGGVGDNEVAQFNLFPPIISGVEAALDEL